MGVVPVTRGGGKQVEVQAGAFRPIAGGRGHGSAGKETARQGRERGWGSGGDHSDTSVDISYAKPSLPRKLNASVFRLVRIAYSSPLTISRSSNKLSPVALPRMRPRHPPRTLPTFPHRCCPPRYPCATSRRCSCGCGPRWVSRTWRCLSASRRSSGRRRRERGKGRHLGAGRLLRVWGTGKQWELRKQ